MPAISSVLRAAESTRNKRLQLEDDLAAYKWNNSEQTADDYAEYRKYLETRYDETSDPGKRLSIQNRVNSARTSYTSNEIQRTAIDILEGNATLGDKQAVVLNLYKEAVNAGDFNLAQNLRNTYDSIDLQLQKQAEADATRMAGFAESMSKAQVTTLTELADSYLEGMDENNPNLSNKQVAESFQKYGTDFMNDTATVNGVTYNMWDKVYDNVDKAIQALTEASNVAYAAGNDTKGDSLYEKAIALSNGESKVKFGNMSLTIDDINNARDAARNGQNLFQAVKDENGVNQLVKTKITNYLWARDTSGNLRIVQTRDEVPNSFDRKKYADDGEEVKLSTGESDTVKNRLKAAGYEVVGEENGLLRIRDTNTTGRTNADPDSSLGESYLVAYDMQTGNVRYVGENGTEQKVYEINLADPDNTQDFGAAREIDADAETFFGNSLINSSASDEGVNYINKLLTPANRRQMGLNEIDPSSGISIYTGNWKDAYKGGASGIAAAAAMVKRENMAQRLQDASANVIPAESRINIQTTGTVQNTVGTNLNQLPVPAASRIVVAPTLPAPKVTVTDTKNTTPVKVVTPTSKPVVKVEAPKKQPTLKVL